ncbi:MAG: LamG domain-containing protein [Nannocystales bacterium]
MRPLRLIGCSLAVLSCTRINPGYADSGTDAGAATEGRGKPSGTTLSSGGSSSQTHGEGEGEGTTEPPDTEPPAEWVFTDDEAHEFEAGQLDHVYWSDQEAVELEPSMRLGTLRSRVFTTGGHPARLTELEWTPPAPYGIGLSNPDVDEVEGYDFGGTSSVGLELLLRFELAADTVEVGDLVPDTSFAGAHGTLGGTALAVTRGVFGRAVSNPGDGFVEHAQTQLAPGTNEFTWTAWYRMDGCTGASIVSFDAPDNNDNGTSSVWLVCNNNIGCSGAPDPDHGIFEAVAFAIANDGSRQGPRVCGLAEIDDDQWHHVAVRMNHSGGGSRLSLFVDGVPDESAREDSPSQHDFAQGPLQDFTTAGNPSPAHTGAGTYDEIALWDRPLTDDEIRDLHARGAAGVELRLRACTLEDCSDDPPFLGPAGASGVGFLDSGPDEGHAHALEPSDYVGIAFQYELRITRDSAALRSPLIPSVSIVAEPAEED